MGGEDLHKYDLQLCDAALGNIAQYLGEEEFASAASFALAPPILKYLQDDLNPDIEEGRLLLSDNEFFRLEGSFAGDVPELDRYWLACKYLHGRHVYCVGEIREELTRQDAEDWSRASAGFAERLEKKRLRLREGIEIVHEWVYHLRRLLRAMGAISFLPCPEGRSPTPTCSTQILPSGSSPLRNQFAEDMDVMREAITQHERGRSAQPDTLIKIARIRPQRARKALRALEKAGEYSGFTRPQPRRYQEGRPNEK